VLLLTALLNSMVMICCSVALLLLHSGVVCGGRSVGSVYYSAPLWCLSPNLGGGQGSQRSCASYIKKTVQIPILMEEYNKSESEIPYWTRSIMNAGRGV
jgi:hypothetical protein